MKDEILRIGDYDLIDKNIHEPGRLVIMIYLNMLASADFNFLLYKTGMSKGNLSSHLTKLEQAGYIEVQKEFINKTPHTVLLITEEGKKAVVLYKKQLMDMLILID